LQQPRLRCAECGSPLACNLDCFTALGLSRKLRIDGEALERAYHDLGRQLHPDRFANAPGATRDLSLRSTAQLTRAYRTLRDPVSRGLYWLELNGRRLAENNQQVNPELAAMVFEAQEELSELRAAAGPGAAEVSAVKDRLSSVQGELDQLQARLERSFEAFDGVEAEPSEQLFNELKKTLSEIAYLRTLARDIEKTLDRSAAA
jgi:molecular chaperone HscB